MYELRLFRKSFGSDFIVLIETESRRNQKYGTVNVVQMRKNDYGSGRKGVKWRTKGMADLLAGTERRLRCL
jgi:hypothetical protein